MEIIRNQYETINLAEKDSWLTIWLDRPKAKNALSDKMTQELMQILNEVADNKTIRGLALRGAGNCFCSGADLKDFQTTLRFMNSADRYTTETREQRKNRILQTDEYRKENFSEVFPLLNSVLKIYD